MTDYQHEEWETDQLADRQRRGRRIYWMTLSWLILLALAALVIFIALAER